MDSKDQAKSDERIFNEYRDRTSIPVEAVPKTPEGIAAQAVRDWKARKAFGTQRILIPY